VAGVEVGVQAVQDDRYLVALSGVPGRELFRLGLDPPRRRADRGDPQQHGDRVPPGERDKEKRPENRGRQQRRHGARWAAQDQPADELGGCITAQQGPVEVEHRDRLGQRRASSVRRHALSPRPAGSISRKAGTLSGG